MSRTVAYRFRFRAAGAVAGVVLVAAHTCGTALGQTAGITVGGNITQSTAGACSHAIVSEGPVSISCTFIDFSQFIAMLRAQVAEKRALAAAGDPDAKIIVATIDRKLQDPEQAYAKFLDAARVLVAQLDTIQKVQTDLSSKVITDASQGNVDAQLRILARLPPQESAAKTDVASFAISIAKVMQSSGDLSNASVVYAQALEKAPNSGALLRSYASLLYEMGEIDKSTRLLEGRLKANETSSQLSNADMALIYDALGQAHQGVGRLDSAAEKFEFARRLGLAARKDGSLSRIDLAWIFNDSAGPAIRRKDFTVAEGFLCWASDEFEALRGPQDQSTLTARLNLAVVQREMGEWGSSKRSLDAIQSALMDAAPNDPMRGYSAIIAAQTTYFLGDLPQSKKLLDTGEKFFTAEYKKSGAHAQRLGRIWHYRALIALEQGNLNAAAQNAKTATKLFRVAYGKYSFDELVVSYWMMQIESRRRNRAVAQALYDQFLEGAIELKLVGREWSAYGRIAYANVLVAKGTTAEPRKILRQAVGELLEIEATTKGYDPLTDAGIVQLVRLETGATVVSRSDVRNFRKTKNARIGNTAAAATCKSGPDL